eukprot:CAMPEP_0113989540 /NCGR_PEP_ID=MMETSP0328-20130328/8087_1 /TAXON_ID=39455 /ORGANISM="Alexandrium minutum" /LENGTH=36 /assembly_acc=CAM_ASM_000350
MAFRIVGSKEKRCGAKVTSPSPGAGGKGHDCSSKSA